MGRIKDESAQSRKNSIISDFKGVRGESHEKGQTTMFDIEAGKLLATHLITWIQGEWYDARHPAQIDPNHEPGFIWVLMAGIHDEHHYSKWYRLGQYETVRGI